MKKRNLNKPGEPLTPERRALIDLQIRSAHFIGGAVWKGKSFKKHNKSLSPSQATHAARIANAVLKSTGDEGEAIATANKIIGRKDQDPMRDGYHKLED